MEYNFSTGNSWNKIAEALSVPIQIVGPMLVAESVQIAQGGEA